MAKQIIITEVDGLPDQASEEVRGEMAAATFSVMSAIHGVCGECFTEQVAAGDVSITVSTVYTPLTVRPADPEPEPDPEV